MMFFSACVRLCICVGITRKSGARQSLMSKVPSGLLDLMRESEAENADAATTVNSNVLGEEAKEIARKNSKFEQGIVPLPDSPDVSMGTFHSSPTALSEHQSSSNNKPDEVSHDVQNSDVKLTVRDESNTHDQNVMTPSRSDENSNANSPTSKPSDRIVPGRVHFDSNLETQIETDQHVHANVGLALDLEDSDADLHSVSGRNRLDSPLSDGDGDFEIKSIPNQWHVLHQQPSLSLAQVESKSPGDTEGDETPHRGSIESSEEIALQQLQQCEDLLLNFQEQARGMSRCTFRSV